VSKSVLSRISKLCVCIEHRRFDSHPRLQNVLHDGAERETYVECAADELGKAGHYAHILEVKAGAFFVSYDPDSFVSFVTDLIGRITRSSL
jgi:hypothetical protein